MTPSTDPGEMIPGVNHLLNIEGLLRTLEEVPTYTPRNLADQLVLVTNGGSTRAYFYETVGRAWKYVALT